MKTWFLIVVAVATFIVICETSMYPLVMDANIGMMIDDPVPVRLRGKFTWKEIYPDEKAYTYYKNISGSHSELRQAIRNRAIKKNVTGLAVGGEFEFLQFKIEKLSDRIYAGHYRDELVDFYNQILDSDHEIATTSGRIDAMSIEKTLYQLIYKGPGVEFYTGIVTVHPQDVPDVIINCQIRVTNMIKGVGVTLTEDLREMPRSVITESKYGNPDINAGFSGDYAFLYPIWTNLKEEAATSIKLHSVDLDLDMESNHDILVLPLGASGITNNLEMNRTDIGGKLAGKRITRLSLLRDVPLDQHCTDDLE